MIAVFAALAPEVRACLGPGQACEEGELAGHAVLWGDGLLIARTGVGRRAREVAEAIIERARPLAVVSAGLCGGLSPAVQVGDLIVGSGVDHEEQRETGEREGVRCDERLMALALEAAHEAGVPARQGACLTVDEAAWGPAEKSALRSWKGHEAVEMESFWVGQAAARHGIPFVVTRAVSDGFEHQLPQGGWVTPDGTIDAAQLRAWLQANPHLAGEFAAQAERARAALTNLSRFLPAYLPMLVRSFQAAKR